MTGDVNQAHLKKLDELPKGWAETSVNEVVKMISTNGKKLPQKKYMEKADHPVIDQGQDYIGGYYEDENLLVEGEPPFVIFGDHSRAFKYANFHFIPGADGVKVMQLIGIDPKWAFYIFQAIALPNKGYARHFQYLKEAYLPVPPLEQQKRIVAKIEELFSHIDAGIAALNKAKQLLKQYRQSVLKAAVTGELTKEWREQNKNKLEPASQLLERILQERRQKWEAQQLEQFKAKGKMPKDDGWKCKYKEPEEVVLTELPELPKEWIWGRLDSIAFVGTGMSVSKSRKVNDPIDVAYLRVANVQRGYLVLGEIKTMQIEKTKLAELQLQEWDVLYNEGGDIDKLGRGWIWENQVQPCITQNHVFRASPYIKERSHSIFLSIWGNTFGQEYFIDTGKQTTNLASINKGVLSAFPTPIPPLEEQKKIIELVEEKLASIERLETEVSVQLVKAEKNKQSILASAFSGKIIGV